MENDAITKWVNSGSGYGYGDGSGYGSGYGSGSGYGYGDGYGSGYGYGYGSGDGSGSGSGYGDGSGSGYGYGYGDGYGSGYGDGSGSGSGYGDGDGSGDGSGYGSGCKLLECNGNKVYYIDGIPTVIKYIHGNVASGYTINTDATITNCFIAKGRGYYAHGQTLQLAVEALREKILSKMSVTDKINEFVSKFEKEKRYVGSLYFEWHNILTGSCLFGRNEFIRSKGLDLNSKYTVKEFIELCENDYGGEIIKKLKEYYD